MSTPAPDNPRQSQSLARGIAVLQCFSGDAPTLGIAQLADATGMSRPTTHRYTLTLVELGFLEQPPSSSRKYRLASRCTDLGLAKLNALPVRAASRPILHALRSKVSHTVSLAVLDGDKIVLVTRLRGARGDAKLKLDLGPGSRLPVHCTSMGKVLLAHLPEKERAERLSELALGQHGPNTITDRRQLEGELEQVRQAGFGLADEELKRGVRAIAVAVREGSGEVVAAVNIAVPSATVERIQLIENFGPELYASAERISAALGYPANSDQTSEE